MSDNCIFCKIVRGELPSFNVYEDDCFLAFLDISQFTKGHTLLIPKEHIDNIWNVGDIGKYMSLVQKIGRHYKEIGYPYVDIMVFGRDVNHVHVHLIPNDKTCTDYYEALSKLGQLQSDRSRMPTTEDGQKLVEKLKL